MKYFLYSFCFSLISFLSAIEQASALAGGGGSSSGGGGSSSGGGSGDGGGGDMISTILVLIIAVIFIQVSIMLNKRRVAKIKKEIAKAGETDPIWNNDELLQFATNTFNKLQSDWSEFNTASIYTYCTPEFAEKLSLEMEIINNLGRKNYAEDLYTTVNILKITDMTDNNFDSFTASIKILGYDVLFDTRNNLELSRQGVATTELWHFIRYGNTWLLQQIKQTTTSASLTENKIKEFAEQNGLFYDPDFGYLTLPNRGVLFNRKNYLDSDVNNHVIGRHDTKVVELYTYIPNKQKANKDNYLVAQIPLSVSYNNILVRKRHWLWNRTPEGMRYIQTESNDFNKKFCLYASPQDTINSFVLLMPDYMEKVYNLPFELNIEVIDNILYLYTKKRKVDYHKMFSLLTEANRSLRSN